MARKGDCSRSESELEAHYPLANIPGDLSGEFWDGQEEGVVGN